MQAFSMILAGLAVVVAGMGTGGSAHAAERRSKTPTSDLLGEWRTPKGASPAVSIVFRGKTREVTIDGKAIPMTGGQLSVDGFQKLFHFQKLEMAANGGERYSGRQGAPPPDPLAMANGPAAGVDSAANA